MAGRAATHDQTTERARRGCQTVPELRVGRAFSVPARAVRLLGLGLDRYNKSFRVPELFQRRLLDVQGPDDLLLRIVLDLLVPYCALRLTFDFKVNFERFDGCLGSCHITPPRGFPCIEARP